VNTYTVGQPVDVIGSYVYGMPSVWVGATVTAVYGLDIEVTFANGAREITPSDDIRAL